MLGSILLGVIAVIGVAILAGLGLWAILSELALTND